MNGEFFFFKENIASNLPTSVPRYRKEIGCLRHFISSKATPEPPKKKFKNPSHSQSSLFLIPEKQKPAWSCRSKGKKQKQNPTRILEILTRGDSKRYFSRKKHLRQRLEKAEVQGESKRKTLSFQLTRLGKRRGGGVGDTLLTTH